MTYSVLVVDMFKAPLKESKHTVGGFATLERLTGAERITRKRRQRGVWDEKCWKEKESDAASVEQAATILKFR